MAPVMTLFSGPHCIAQLHQYTKLEIMLPKMSQPSTVCQKHLNCALAASVPLKMGKSPKMGSARIKSPFAKGPEIVIG